MAYDAFISYSHAADSQLAPRLQDGLQRMAKPWWRRRSLRVFRDQTGLSANPGLWSSIESAMDDAGWFVFLASPEAAASPWVEREIGHWIDTHGSDRILPVLTDGTWAWDAEAGDFDWAGSTAVPAVLAGVFAEEPRHVDMSWARSEDQVDLRNGRFRDQVAEIAAPIHGVAKDDLEGADVREHRRTLRWAWGAAAALLLLALASGITGLVAVRNADEAAANAEEAALQRISAEESAADAEEAQEDAELSAADALESEADALDAARKEAAAAVAEAEAAERARAKEQEARESEAAAVESEQAALESEQAALESEQQALESQEQTQAALESEQAAKSAEETARQQADQRAVEAAAAAEKARASETLAVASERKALQAAEAELTARRAQEQEAARANAGEQQARAAQLVAEDAVKTTEEARRDEAAARERESAARKSAETEALAAASSAQASQDGPLSLLLAVEAAGRGGSTAPALNAFLAPRAATATAEESVRGRQALFAAVTAAQGGVDSYPVDRFLPFPPEVTDVPAYLYRSAISPDGRYLAAAELSDAYRGVRGSAPTRLFVWDLRSATPSVKVLSGHQQPVSTVRFAAGGRTLVTQDVPLEDDGAPVTRLWDVASGTELTAQVGLPYLSPTGDDLAVQGYGVDEVTIVDAVTGQVLVRQPGVLSVDASAIDRSDAPQPTPLVGRPFSADGRYALGEQAGRAVLWDLSAGGGPTDPLLGPGALFSALPRVSPRGDLAVAIENGTDLALFDLSTGQTAGSFQVTADRVTSLSFNANGSLLAVQDSTGLLQVFNLEADGYWAKVGPVGDVEFTRDGRHVLVTWQAGVDANGFSLFVTDLYDPTSGALVARAEGEYLATSRGDRPQLFLRRWDRTLAVSDLASGRSVLTDPPGKQIGATTAAADGSRLAVATTDGVRVWNLSTDSPPVPATDLAPVALGLSFAPDSGRLVGVGIGSTPTVWNLDRVGNGETIGATSAYSSTILEDGVTVLEPTDGSRTAVRYRNLVTGETRPGPALQPGDVVDFPLVGAEGTPHVVNLVGGGAVVARPDGSVIGRTPGQVRTTSRDGSIMAVAEPGRSVSIVRTADLSVVATIDLDELPDDDLPAQADGIALGPDGSLLAATNGTGSTVVWDVASGRVLTQLDGRPTDRVSFPLWGLGFSPDGSRLVVKSPANDVRMYRVGGTGTWETLATERLPAQYAGRVVFSPDGELVVVDGLFVLDGQTLAPITTLLDGPGAVTRFTSDGGSLVTISVPEGTPRNAQRSVVRWGVSTDELTATACRIAGRNLTRDEWNRYLGSTGQPYRTTCS